MTNAEMTRKLYRDFSDAELQMLGTKSVTTVHNMAKDDRIIIEDSLLDYLRDFFNGIFDGEPIPKVFSSVLIEWKSVNALMRMYVSFPEDKPDWVYIDVFQGWTFLGKVLYPNLKLDDSERNDDGQFFGFTPFLTVVHFPEEVKQALIPAVKDIFTYAYLYVQANKEEKVLFKEEPKAIPGQNNKKSKKKANKAKMKSDEDRDKVFVPTRRVYTLKKTETSERALCEYVYSRWKVRGYSYTRKDGRVVNVKEHYAFRHFPNKGIDKEGKDFILRKGEDANS